MEDAPRKHLSPALMGTLAHTSPFGSLLHPGIIIENQPAGAFAGKVHALVNSYQYTPGYGNGEKVVIVQDANHKGVSFIRGEELTVTGIGNGGTVNGRIIYRPSVDKGGLWLHGLERVHGGKRLTAR